MSQEKQKSEITAKVVQGVSIKTKVLLGLVMGLAVVSMFGLVSFSVKTLNKPVVTEKIANISSSSNFSSIRDDLNKNNGLLKKRVYVISDLDWRDVFQLIPNAKIRNNKIKPINNVQNNLRSIDPNENYLDCPILIYHEEESGFDVDSVVHFLNQYEAEQIILIETGDFTDSVEDVIVDNVASITAEDVFKIFPEEMISYIGNDQNSDKIVYVQEDYSFAMLAATYSSVLGFPLIVQNSYFDSQDNFEDKQIILVGDELECPSDDIEDCIESYDSIYSLQQAYIYETGTNKIIVVNPNDINSNFIIDEWPGVPSFETELNNNFIQDLYYKTSLSAPILAKAKKELILFYSLQETPFNRFTCNDPEQPQFVGDFDVFRDNIEAQVQSLDFLNGISFLTVLAVPNAITDSVDWKLYDCEEGYQNFLPTRKWGTDRLILADLYSDIKIGRIYSLTSSDVSAYIARAIYYDELFENIYGLEDLTFQTINARIIEGIPNSLDDSDFHYLIYSSILRLIAQENGYSTEKALFNCDSDFLYPPDLDIVSAFSSFFRHLAQSVLNALDLEESYPEINYLDGANVREEFITDYSSYLYDCETTNFDYQSLSYQQIIFAITHGVTEGWVPFLLTEDLPNLNLAYVISPSCQTNFFWQSFKDSDNSPVPRYNNFGANILRKGGIAAQGLVTQGQGPIMLPQTLLMVHLFNNRDITLGEMDKFLIDTNIPDDNNLNQAQQFTLLGDPTVFILPSRIRSY